MSFVFYRYWHEKETSVQLKLQYLKQSKCKLQVLNNNIIEISRFPIKYLALYLKQYGIYIGKGPCIMNNFYFFRKYIHFYWKFFFKPTVASFDVKIIKNEEITLKHFILQYVSCVSFLAEARNIDV